MTGRESPVPAGQQKPSANRTAGPTSAIFPADKVTRQ
jgi:hypothetical protein